MEFVIFVTLQYDLNFANYGNLNLADQKIKNVENNF
nr:MAG TPA: hypothetical protein [Caudoviricetes sp.]DAY12880.1 MAG TPA: hypothetical protein [Caudoviricetes sp.]